MALSLYTDFKCNCQHIFFKMHHGLFHLSCIPNPVVSVTDTDTLIQHIPPVKRAVSRPGDGRK